MMLTIQNVIKNVQIHQLVSKPKYPMEKQKTNRQLYHVNYLPTLTQLKFQVSSIQMLGYYTSVEN